MLSKQDPFLSDKSFETLVLLKAVTGFLDGTFLDGRMDGICYGWMESVMMTKLPLKVNA